MNNIHLLTVKGVTAVQGMHDRIMDVKTLLESNCCHDSNYIIVEFYFI